MSVAGTATRKDILLTTSPQQTGTHLKYAQIVNRIE